MKTSLSLAIILISTFAWAMPSAQASAVATVTDPVIAADDGDEEPVCRQVINGTQYLDDTEDLILKSSPVFKVEKVEDLLKSPPVIRVEEVEGLGTVNITNGPMAKTFTIEGRTVKLGARSMTRYSDDYPDGTPALEWNITTPTDLDIREMKVVQNDAPIPVDPMREDTITYDSDALKRDCSMDRTLTGDIEVTFQYRIIPLPEVSPTFTIEKVEGLIGKKGQSRTFMIEGHAVTLRARKMFFVDAHDEKPSKDTASGIEWTLSFPKGLDIEEMKMVVQGDESFWISHVQEEDTADGIQKMRCMMHRFDRTPLTGDIEITFLYRIVPIDKDAPQKPIRLNRRIISGC